MHSLRVKFLAPFLLGAFLLTLSLSWYTYSSARNAVTDAITLLSKTQTKALVNTFAQFLTAMSGALEKMASDDNIMLLFSQEGPEQRQAIVPQVQHWLDMLVQNNSYHRNIIIVDVNGICIAANSSMQIGVSYAKRPYVKSALQGAIAFGDFIVGRRTKNFSAAAATPINIGGKVVGAVLAINDLPQIISYEDSMGSDANALFSAFLAPDGRFVAHKDERLLGIGNPYYFTELYSQLAELSADGGPVEYTIEGKKYAGYAALSPINKWVVITSGLENEVFASAYQMGLVVFCISLVIFCGICFGVIRTANGLLNTLFSLINYAKGVSEGQLDLQMESSDRKDELGILRQALSSLVQSLKEMVNSSQEASKLKSQFLANMSHEIRTPLNAIVGITYLSLGDPELKNKQRDYLGKIQMAAKSLLGIINNILDISKIEAGVFELDHIPFDLRSTIEDIVVIHQEAAHTKNIELVLNYQANVPRFFVGDPLRIGQIMNNLLSNAIKFTDHGRVLVTCSYAGPAPGSSRKAIIKISVADGGIGISQEQMENLFQPFTQADASITRRFGGTGLGLAISEKIVHMLEGGFSVKSQLGQGSVFAFDMKLQLDSAQHATLAPDATLHDAWEQLDLSGRSILVAEDNRLNQFILQKFLAPTKARVVLVDNGLEAVKIAQEDNFDLIFMDVQMPVMDGIQASKKIREFAALKDLPIIAVTANAMKEDRDEAFAAGLNDYLTKPVEPFQLFAVLQKWLAPKLV